MEKIIRYKKETSINVDVSALRFLARYIKIDAGQLSSILNGKVVTSEELANKILKGIKETKNIPAISELRKIKQRVTKLSITDPEKWVGIQGK